jgi:hypothetical protein
VLIAWSQWQTEGETPALQFGGESHPMDSNAAYEITANEFEEEKFLIVIFLFLCERR